MPLTIWSSANGTRYQVGSRVVRAPTGSLAIALFKFESEPASSTPYTTRSTGAMAAPKVVHATTPTLDALRGRYRE